MQQKKPIRGILVLLLISVIWGSTFTVQDMAAEHIGPFTFNFFRYLVGTVTLIPVAAIAQAVRRRNGTHEKVGKKTLVTAAIISGLALFAPAAFQQAGIAYTSSGKAGFITAMYIVFVPLLGLFMKKKAGLAVWIAVAVSGVGLWLLCMTERLTVGKGELLVLCSAVFWAVQILVIDTYADKINCFVLACGECFVCAVLSGVMMAIFETPVVMADVLRCTVPVLYSGVLSCGIAFALQPFGQKDASPAAAAIAMSLESVFAAVAGFFILGERMTAREYIGCVLMFAAVILVQLPEFIAGKKENMA
ncbi:MAG: DMT family transporter [Ruminococcaceae bacterium]|nr:DMT family transporter [Oscillospiraceae bacterium]